MYPDKKINQLHESNDSGVKPEVSSPTPKSWFCKVILHPHVTLWKFTKEKKKLLKVMSKYLHCLQTQSNQQNLFMQPKLRTKSISNGLTHDEVKKKERGVVTRTPWRPFVSDWRMK